MDSAEKQDFLKYFGAVHVRVLSNFGRMKHTAFATFKDRSAAAKALSRLHQLNVLGHTLVVEYAKNSAPSQAETVTSSSEDRETAHSANRLGNSEQAVEPTTQTTTYAGGTKAPQQRVGMSPSLGVDFPLNPVLRYRYPTPTVGILSNIVNSLASVPKFYTQVLHLMNKMNLPAPYGPVTPAPPLMEDDTVPLANDQTVMAMEVSSSSEEESEIESDLDEKERTEKVKPPLKRPSKTKTPHHPKRHRLQPLMQPRVPQVGGASASSQQAKAVDVFESSAQAPVGKRIEFRLTEGIPASSDGFQVHPVGAQSGQMLQPNDAWAQEMGEKNPGATPAASGFGTFEPPTTEKEAPPKNATLEEEEEEEEEDDGAVTEFISRRELRNRLPDHEVKRHPVFKRYEAGEPTTRLYLKNLAKTVQEKDLKYIYGRYVDWSSPLDRDMFTIQLMTQGRMKGQAFVGLPSEFAAQKALRDTNAYILQGKPIVVQFARSAKLKEKEEKEPKVKTKGRREI